MRSAVSRAAGLGRAVVAHFVEADAHDAHQESPAHQGMKAFMASEIRRIVVFDKDVLDLAPASPSPA